MALRISLFALLFIPLNFVMAQQASIRGVVFGEKGVRLFNAEINWLEENINIPTNQKGQYKLSVTPGVVTLIVRFEFHKETRIQLTVRPNDDIVQNIDLALEIKTYEEVVIEGKREEDSDRMQISTVKIDPKIPKYLPSAFGDFNKILATVGLGVVSNSELSSQYNVRGGNFDENLIYVNGMEVYRPFLVRTGQQEGLSFVNPDLVADIEFSAGGWQAKYGDKLSSVMAIKYKEPKRFKGSATAGLLGFAAHLENATPNNRLAYVVGVRNKSSRYLLNTLPTKGEYRPIFYDVQSLITLDLTKRKDPLELEKRSTLSLLSNYSVNQYSILPTKSQTNFGTLDNALRLDVVFSGKELMTYNTFQNGLTLKNKLSKRMTIETLGSLVYSKERESLDIETIYRLCEIETSQNAANFNQCILTKGAGSNFRHARNELQLAIVTLGHKGQYKWNSSNEIEWGVSGSNERINDQLAEYSFEDSAQFVTVSERLFSKAVLSNYRVQGYLQHTLKLDSLQTISYGVRLNYTTLNTQLLVSPRIQYAFRPKWKRDVVFKTAVGVYQQAPFYREMRNFSGVVNTSLKAQQSYHAILGLDYNFSVANRKFKFISEAYYKYFTNIVPYDMDNVRLRYYGINNAKAYATGVDFRVSGEFIKGEESWFSLSFLDTKEDVLNDSKGYIRRPSDQRITAGIFFQDHIPNNPSLKMYLNLVYGSGLPFGPPRVEQFRSRFSGPSYNRVDIGFSKLISFKDLSISSKKGLESLWISIEVLNLLGVSNTISYSWFQDFNANQYAVPNTLSSRFLNLRMIARFK